MCIRDSSLSLSRALLLDPPNYAPTASAASRHRRLQQRLNRGAPRWCNKHSIYVQARLRADAPWQRLREAKQPRSRPA
eukprot:13274021-Alexandrium_andersonii.AAC.1